MGQAAGQSDDDIGQTEEEAASLEDPSLDKDESKTDYDEAGVIDHEVPASAPALNGGTKQFTGQDELKEDEIQTTEITTDTENTEAMGNAEKMEISESVGNSKPEMKVGEDIFKAGEVFNSNEIAGN